MKKYLTGIQSGGGSCATIGYYTDTPNKNYRIYYCGSDTGERFEYIGNAARYLEKLAETWNKNGVTGIKKQYSTADKIPRSGSNP